MSLAPYDCVKGHTRRQLVLDSGCGIGNNASASRGASPSGPRTPTLAGPVRSGPGGTSPGRSEPLRRQRPESGGGDAA